MSSNKEVKYEGWHASLKTLLWADWAVPETLTLVFWFGGSDLREEWFVDNRVYLARIIDFDICFRQHQEEWRRLFVGWHNVKVLDMRSVRHAELFVLVPTFGLVMTRRVCCIFWHSVCFHIVPVCIWTVRMTGSLWRWLSGRRTHWW